MSPKTAAAPGSSKRLKTIAGSRWTSHARGRRPCFIDAKVDLGISFAQSLTTLSHVKLYVGNISFTITEADLQHIFEQFGSVTEIKVVTDRETGQPRGFAFVTMSNDQAGRAAIKSLDGKEFGGRPLKVSEARPKEDRPPRSSSRPRR